MEPANITLEEYQIQRKYREQKRKQYLKKFQLLKLKMGLQSSSSPSFNAPQYIPSQEAQPRYQQIPKRNQQPEQQSQKDRIQKQNQELKAQLAELQQKQRNNLLNFKQKIADVKSKYIERITTINNQAKQMQASGLDKIQKLSSQIKSAQDKNAQISKFNGKIKSELQQSNAMMQKYSTQIKNQYATKLDQFQKIFATSSQKIQAMQKQYDDEQFIDSTINNEDLINTIRQNSEKASQDIQNILSDYQELLTGKTEILKQLMTNNEMKQRQINKMGQLQGKLKTVFDKLNQEKKIYIEQNTKMAQELMEVKNLLMGNLPENA